MTSVDDTCRRVCRDLVADRGPLALDGTAAVALRHLLREQGLSGIAAVAVDADQLRVPAAVREGIRQDWTSALHQSLLLDGECSRLGRLAAQHPLSPPLLLKGPAVARRYTNPSTRTYVDIDLLVPANQVRAWATLLGHAGYWAPTPEIRSVERRYREGAEFTRRSDTGHQHSVDLHTCVFVERRARHVGYTALAARAEPQAFPGLLQAALDVQLVILALHLAHHGAADHRLIWYRDIIELSDPTTVQAARTFAARHDILWAVEHALLAVEGILGHPAWQAQTIPVPPFGMASVHQLGRPEYLRHLALFHDLGPIAATRYLATRLDPRRFTTPDGTFDRSAARAWLTQAAIRARSTPLSKDSRRRR